MLLVVFLRTQHTLCLMEARTQCSGLKVYVITVMVGENNHTWATRYNNNILKHWIKPGFLNTCLSLDESTHGPARDNIIIIIDVL